jgi:enoyl-CoA hydratase
VVPQAELLATCKKLAQDMLTVVPESLNAYKALIDEGYAQAYGDGLKTEQKVSASANSAVSADAIENRREGIRERGKAQTS